MNTQPFLCIFFSFSVIRPTFDPIATYPSHLSPCSPHQKSLFSSFFYLSLLAPTVAEQLVTFLYFPFLVSPGPGRQSLFLFLLCMCAFFMYHPVCLFFFLSFPKKVSPSMPTIHSVPFTFTLMTPPKNLSLTFALFLCQYHPKKKPTLRTLLQQPKHPNPPICFFFLFCFSFNTKKNSPLLFITSLYSSQKKHKNICFHRF